jgi:predicted RNA-binding Zn-ribbon protein involved in translation (DUF1610 family)
MRIHSGVVSGKPDNLFDPKGTATRVGVVNRRKLSLTQLVSGLYTLSHGNILDVAAGTAAGIVLCEEVQQMDRCQGVENTITPQIIEFACPECGEELEMFSNDESVTCSCGRVIQNTSNLPLSVGTKA